MRVSPDASRSGGADHPGMAYAVLWSENDGAPHAGRLDLGACRLSLAGLPGRELSYDDVTEVRIDRRPLHRLAGRPTLVVESRSGDVVRIASLDGAGTLHELAERLDSARHPA